MHQLWTRGSGVLLAVLLAVLAGCTSLNERQLMSDPLVYESDRLIKEVNLERAEFDQLVAEYRLNGAPAHLVRINTLIELVEEEVRMARLFGRYQRFYPRGLSYRRWAESRAALELSRRHLCQMLFAAADLQLVEAGNPDEARRLLRKLIQEFPEPAFGGWRRLAQNRLWQLGKNGPSRAMTTAVPACGE